MKVRTRIAPSPTGTPHVGTGYIALFNYCFARQHGGEFILRIEDTDQARSSSESEQQILDSLRWLGLDWDEGPDCGGEHGPYRQSERADIYREHIDTLLDNGHAFHCFCSSERLDGLRREQMANKQNPGYDGHCQHLSADEVASRKAAGEPYVIRMTVPQLGSCVVRDRLRDPIEIHWSQVDMQVLMKSDGLPTYHFANVVDDHLMGITHVLRGEEWITSAPKHLRLYEAFGWQPPELIHLPLLRNPDKSKLSKRKNPTSTLYYERVGILPEALLNYLGHMAWTMPNEQEKFSLDEMVANFDIDRVSLGGPIFAIDKLNWLNGLWLRELSEDEFGNRVAEWALNPDYLKRIIPLVQQRTDQLSDLGNLCGHFFQGLLNLTPEQLVVKQLEPAEVQRALNWTLAELDQSREWNADAIEAVLGHVADLLGVKRRVLLAPIFIAITGKSVSTPLYETMAIIGRDLCRARIQQAMEALGPVGKKALKRWDKEYQAALRNLQQASDASSHDTTPDQADTAS